MAQLLAYFWLSAGQWLESRGMGVVAGDCYRVAGAKGGKRGAKSLWHLGRLEFANGQLPEALAAYRQSVELDPANAAIWCDFGIANREAAQFGEAGRCYHRALEIDSSSLLALTHIGELHLLKGEADAALGYFARVLDLSPLYHDALVKRVAALIECDKAVDAEQAARQAIEHYPDSADLHISLGNALTRAGHKTKGLIAYKKALQIQPDNQEALFTLAILQDDARLLKDSVEFIRRQITLQGESALLQRLLASALLHSGELTEAEAICRKLLEQHPTDGPGWKTLASCTCARGDAASGIEYYKNALELRPEWDDVQSCIAFNSTYLPDLTQEAIFQCHLEWAACHEVPLLEKQYRHPPGKAPGKRLRIGYVSGDLRNHPVGILLQGVLQQHDHGNFEIHCFSASSASDHITEVLRASSDYWHQIELTPDEELAELVKAQGIDILVDLSGHTAGKRLKAFALKPAPIQATWVGYFHSTGMTSIDYFITDRYTTPQPSAQFFSEIPVRMPHSRFCYAPFDFAPEVSEPPFQETGCITFGSFNRLAKLTEPVIDAWSRVVANVPDSRLMIKDWGLFDDETAERLKKRFEACGLAPERLILRSASNYLQMFEQYADVDIALDPFPFNGGMTTLDSLWMGVPVVTLTGVAVVARQSTSMLRNLDLDELIFADVDSYIAGAVALALDKVRLAELRRTIRPRMSRSPLCDAEQFTADLEMLYRRMWQAWCRGEKLGPEIVPGRPVTRRILASTPVTQKIMPSTPVARRVVPGDIDARKEPSVDVSGKTLLHIGCGQADIRQLPAYFHTGWQEIRLDIDPDAHPDIVGTVLDMSAVSSNSVDAVYSSHMLEHLYAHELVIALVEIMRVLKADGILVVTVPDLQTVAQLIVDDRLLDTAYMSPAGPITPFDMEYGHRGFIENGMVYMAHRGGFTLATLIDAIKRAGFEAVTGNRRKLNYDIWALASPAPMANDQLNRLSAQVLP